MQQFSNPREFKAWFERHVALDGRPYTLDDDQARAVLDSHKNTLVTARAGSGKTRVIVAKIAYLVASGQAKLSEIAAFMFNRTAAAEVNQRIGAVEIDGVSLGQLNHHHEIRVASTFHKFALDVTKLSGVRPQLISETAQAALIRESLQKALASTRRKISDAEFAETLRLVNSFITRAGQKYLGKTGLSELADDINQYIIQHRADPSYTSQILLHQICSAAYREYLSALRFPRIDFNLLMQRAICLLEQASEHPAPVFVKYQRYKYLLVDEYQDFSYLFFSLIQALRLNCPEARLFAVGDDWQAINRFAGSDVQYFINFAEFFPEDVTNIPLMTNYRSDRRIVENANHYMLQNYNPDALPAAAFSRKNGKIKRLHPQKTKFDTQDLAEDGLGDGRFQTALAKAISSASFARCPNKNGETNLKKFQKPAVLLKTVYKIVKKHRREQILLLHRHNFTSFAGVTLDVLYQALQEIAVQEGIFHPEDFPEKVRILTMHRSKGLESDVVILLECDRSQVRAAHPHATIFQLFGDTRAAETADQHRLLYVALTRAKHRLYILSSDKKPVA